jgi:hypothetical protein
MVRDHSLGRRIESTGAGTTAAIARRSGDIRMRGLWAPTLGALSETLERFGFPGDRERWIVSDLALGAWRAHQAAREILAQLSGGEGDPVATLLSEPPVYSAPSDSGDTADLFGLLIDAEGRGSTVMVAALELAERAVATWPAGRLGLIVMPRFALPWRVADVAFVEFLWRGLQDAGSPLLLVAGGDDVGNPPAHWRIEWLTRPQTALSPPVGAGLLALLPGVVEPDVARAVGAVESAGAGLVLAGGRVLIGPERVRALAAGLRSRYDRLGALADLPDAWRAYAQMHGSGYFRDTALLCREAWKGYAEGAHDLAIDVMSAAVSSARHLEQRARLLLELQGMRIAAQQAHAAAAIDDPSQALSPRLAGELLQSKGWALTLLGNAPDGDRCLTRAREVLAPLLRDSRRLLYMDNIHALCRLRNGEPDAAMRLETEVAGKIDEFARRDGRRDWHLTYVNALNLARLHRAAHRLECAADAYARAFSCTLGVRSESDAVYANFCLGRLLGERGLARDAFACWMRAGLHWASARLPEALAPRVARSILRGRMPPGHAMVEEIAAALREEILAGARAARIPMSSSPRPDVPAYARVADVAEAWQAGALGLGGDGWSAFLTRWRDRPAYEGPNTLALRALLWTIISASTPGVDVSWTGTVLTDDTFGQELAVTPGEIVASAVRLGVSRLYYGGRLITLSSRHGARLQLALVPALGPGVGAVIPGDGRTLTVTFKRYRPTVVLTGADARFVNVLGKHATLAGHVGGGGPRRIGAVIAQARALERTRIIRLTLAEETVAALFAEAAAPST